MNRSRRSAVILDPYPLWLDAIELVLPSTGVAVVGKATTPEEAIALVDEHRPDLLVAELGTRDGNSFPILRMAQAHLKSLKLVVLARSGEPEDMVEAFEAGAAAYVVKTSHPSDIAAAIRQAFDHSIFFPRPGGVHDVESTRRSPRADGGEARLTKRELEILLLVAEGHSNGVLARMLWVTEQTVKFHLSNIYRKLGVANRTEASRWAHDHELVPIAERAVGN